MIVPDPELMSSDSSSDGSPIHLREAANYQDTLDVVPGNERSVINRRLLSTIIARKPGNQNEEPSLKLDDETSSLQ